MSLTSKALDRLSRNVGYLLCSWIIGVSSIAVAQGDPPSMNQISDGITNLPALLAPYSKDKNYIHLVHGALEQMARIGLGGGEVVISEIKHQDSEKLLLWKSWYKELSPPEGEEPVSGYLVAAYYPAGMFITSWWANEDAENDSIKKEAEQSAHQLLSAPSDSSLETVLAPDRTCERLGGVRSSPHGQINCTSKDGKLSGMIAKQDAAAMKTGLSVYLNCRNKAGSNTDAFFDCLGTNATK